MRGSFTCRVHGSATKAARAWAEYRLGKLKRDQMAIRLFRQVAAGNIPPAMQARMDADWAMICAQVDADEAARKAARHPPLHDPETGVSWLLTPR